MNKDAAFRVIEEKGKFGRKHCAVSFSDLCEVLTAYHGKGLNLEGAGEVIEDLRKARDRAGPETLVTLLELTSWLEEYHRALCSEPECMCDPELLAKFGHSAECPKTSGGREMTDAQILLIFTVLRQLVVGGFDKNALDVKLSSEINRLRMEATDAPE